MFNKKNLEESARRYLSGVLVYSVAMVLYTQNRYYSSFLSDQTLMVLRAFFNLYLTVGLPLQIYSDKKNSYKPREIVRALGIMLKNFGSFTNGFLSGKGGGQVKLSKENKNALLFGLVKLFYIPLMLNFFFANLAGVSGFIKRRLVGGGFIFNFRRDYTVLLSAIFMIDTLFFSFGYFFEHKLLGNVVRSVEPTVLGWGVALASYPPFNSISSGYFGWFSRDFFYFSDAGLDYFLKIMVLLLLLLYLWATISLGTKCSNLTNRGIVGKGAYKYIRHPAYTGKVLSWWIMALPRFSVGMVVSLMAWSFVYFMRAVTEERHLIKDKDYQKYVKKTPFRFIPGVI